MKKAIERRRSEYCFVVLVGYHALGQSAELSYDAAGRETRLAGPDGSVTGYSYDGLGRPVRETAANAALGVTRFHLLLLGLSVLCIVSVSFRLSLYFDC